MKTILDAAVSIRGRDEGYSFPRDERPVHLFFIEKDPHAYHILEKFDDGTSRSNKFPRENVLHLEFTAKTLV